MRPGALSRIAAAALGLAVLAPATAHAQSKEPTYWASLAKDEVNMRVGPGRDYRVAWTYVRKGLPVKVVRLMGGWRLVEEPDGTRGWILSRFLTRARTAIVKGGMAELHEKPDGGGRVLWRAEPGVVGALGECDGGWCRFDVQGRIGYVSQRGLWGAGEP